MTAVPEVRFRYLGIPVEGGEVGGICLSYAHRELARGVANIFTEYVTTSNAKRLRVEFESEGAQSLRLFVEVVTPGGRCEIAIGGIERQHVETIITSLEKYAYYVIAVAYEEDGKLLLFPDGEGRLFKADIMVDGRTIRGKATSPVDWRMVAEKLSAM